MLSQEKHNHRLPHLPCSKNDAQQQQRRAQENVVYLAIALMGGILLVARPALIVFVLLLMGYGKLYHVETHEKSRGLFREKQSEHALHLGPSRAHNGKGGASFPDLVKALNLPKMNN
ncbi:hypothetical protein PV04_01980 [Phialophora macrospora]|uniref:Uncharacterized protein n=1 Tax=Phialophora macrospora TaxID=1851006 RepID=A0A0D2G531_9EURO|nr:hypothetical protein PV04_01980 [Phialophora macrospora]